MHIKYVSLFGWKIADLFQISPWNAAVANNRRDNPSLSPVNPDKKGTYCKRIPSITFSSLRWLYYKTQVIIKKSNLDDQTANTIELELISDQ